MFKPRFPLDEEQRLKDLLSYGILDSNQEKAFDDLVELAAFICGCPIAAISFVDADRQWFKSSKNIDSKETHRDISFCAHTILETTVTIIPDSRIDERFTDNPLVHGDPKIIFYAGAPITSSTGHNIGTICVMDNFAKPTLSTEQAGALQLISRQIAQLLDMRLKNKLIVEQAELLVAAEKKLMQMNISEQEDEKHDIARTLHENFAQTLAATKLYIEFAEQSKDLSPHFLQKSKENLVMVIDEIRSLSNSITPTTLSRPDYTILIEEMVRQWRDEHQLELLFECEEVEASPDGAIGLAIYRVLQQQLRLAVHCKANFIRINLRQDDDWMLHFKADVKSLDASDMHTISLLKTIAARAESVNGQFQLLDEGDGCLLLQLIIPSDPLPINANGMSAN